jgi:two-component system, NarL family, sensor histidine kinase DevS
VKVTEADETIQVRIHDEGRGFDPAAETDGFGLLGMRERVTLAGGTLKVESAPSEGTAVVAVLPARHRDETGVPEERRNEQAEGKAAEGDG